MNTVELNSINLQSIDVASNNVSSIGKSIKRNNKPYIKGHISTSDNTFTFSINNTDVTVNVNTNGNFKYKPTSTITSLSFVGVPQLESLELDNITGVSTFNLDYPVVPVFKKCDATTEAALNYVYHIRGTATADFTFSLKYIADGTGTVSTATESAVVDGDGKWDIAYSGKMIRELSETFKQKPITSCILTDPLSKCTTLYSTFHSSDIESFICNINKDAPLSSIGYCFADCTHLAVIKGLENAKINILTGFKGAFRNTIITELDLRSATFEKCTDFGSTSTQSAFGKASSLRTLNLQSIDSTKLATASATFAECNSLETLIVPNNGTLGVSISFSVSPLSYDSMLRVAGWLKDLSGGIAQTITFKTSAYNALTAEQKAELEGIIVTQKGWVLATA